VTTWPEAGELRLNEVKTPSCRRLKWPRIVAFGYFPTGRQVFDSTTNACFFRETDYLTPRAEFGSGRRNPLPVIGSLVTGGSHLLCGLWKAGARLGRQIAAMDTDSAMIVSTKGGGMLPCAVAPNSRTTNRGAKRGIGRCLSLRWIFANGQP